MITLAYLKPDATHEKKTVEAKVGKSRLRRPDPRNQFIDPPRPNLARLITDHLRTVSVAPDMLDSCAELEPVAGPLGTMRDEKPPFDPALVLGMEMDRDLLDQVPRPGHRLFDFETYVKSGRRVFEVARFIRSRGYRCHARIPFDGWVKYPVRAIKAGLGELGANGVVITRQFGPRVGWTMISIEADLEIDGPTDLNMAAYCDACRFCIRACPGRAISEEKV